MMPQDPVPFYITGGTMSRHAASYVARQADETLFHSLRLGELCYVLTPRQMGKSSLMVRTADRLVRSGVRVALLDLSALGQNLTVAQWYEGMLRYIAAQRRLEDPLDAFLIAHASLPPLELWLKALREVILVETSGSLVIFIDEIDMVRSLPFPTDEFFTGIRAIYNRRDAELELARLTFCLLGVASPADLIDNVNITPFNIGKRIELHDFTATEASTLAQGIDSTGRNGKALLSRVLYWTDGHPYLTQLLCAAVASDPTAQRDQDVDRLCTELFLTRTAQDTDDNLAIVRNRLLRSEGDLMALLTLYGRVRAGKSVKDEETSSLCSVLKLSGITRVEGALLRVRNRIYGQVFDREWIATNLPGAEVRRQRAAYQRGVRRTLALGGVVLAVLTCLTAVALKQTDRANKNATTATKNQKHADDNARLAQQDAAAAHQAESHAVASAKAAKQAEVRASSLLIKANAAESASTQATIQAKRSAVRATSQAKEAAKQRDYAERANYFAEMNLMPLHYENHDARHMVEKLEETKNSPYRGVEWGYWNRLCHLDLMTLTGHTDNVSSVAFSPDSKHLVSGSFDGTAKVWDAKSGKEIFTLQGHTGPVTSVACSPDGTRIVTGSHDHTAGVWDSRNGKQIFTLKAHDDEVRAAAFSPDSRCIVTGSNDKTVKVWDAQTGQVIRTLSGHQDRVESVAFSPDGRRIVSGSSDKTARVWDTRTGSEIRRFVAMTSIKSVAFSPDGKQVVTGSMGYAARVWDIETGRVICGLTTTGYVLGVAFSPDGKSFVAVGSDKQRSATVCNAQSGKEEMTLRGHTDSLSSVAFSPDGKRIATAGCDHTIKLWDAQMRGTFAMHHWKDPTAVAPPADGSPLPKCVNEVTGAAFSADGKRLATCTFGGSIKIWDARTCVERLALKGHTGVIHCIAFSSDGKRIVTGSDDKTARVWDAQTGRELFALKRDAQLWTAVFSPDSKRIVTGSGKEVTIWDARTGQKMRMLSSQKDDVLSVAFSPDGKQLVTGGENHLATVWDVPTGKKLFTLKGHTDRIVSVSFSPNGKYILTGSHDRTAIVSEARTGREICILRGHSEGVNAATFSPDGKRIVTSSDDSTVRVWDAQSGREVLLLKYPDDHDLVQSVAFSPDGKRIISGHHDGSVVVWFSDLDDAQTVFHQPQ